LGTAGRGNTNPAASQPLPSPPLHPSTPPRGATRQTLGVATGGGDSSLPCVRVWVRCQATVSRRGRSRCDGGARGFLQHEGWHPFAGTADRGCWADSRAVALHLVVADSLDHTVKASPEVESSAVSGLVGQISISRKVASRGNPRSFGSVDDGVVRHFLHGGIG
jgi:hypothetical protein